METKTADELIQDMVEVLIKSDPTFLERIANLVLDDARVIFIGGGEVDTYQIIPMK